MYPGQLLPNADIFFYFSFSSASVLEVFNSLYCKYVTRGYTNLKDATFQFRTNEISACHCDRVEVLLCYGQQQEILVSSYLANL